MGSIYGLGIPIFNEIAKGELENSKKLTNHLVESIINHSQDMKKIKLEMKSTKSKAQNETLERLRKEMNPIQRKLNELACAKGASIWLMLLPIANEGYDINKELFWDLKFDMDVN